MYNFFNVLVFLGIYPGVFGYDSIFEIDRNPMNRHYSVIFCYIISFLYHLGNDIFGNHEAGCAIFVILQIIFLSLVSNKIAITVYSYSKSFILWIFSIIFYCLYTFYKLMVVSVA